MEMTWRSTTFNEVSKKLDEDQKRGVNLFIDGVPFIELYGKDYPFLMKDNNDKRKDSD